MDKVKSSPRRSVHCPKCGRFLFNIVITMERPRTGAMGAISDFRCDHCGQKSMVLFGASDADRRQDYEKVEERLKQSIAADKA